MTGLIIGAVIVIGVCVWLYGPTVVQREVKSAIAKAKAGATAYLDSRKK